MRKKDLKKFGGLEYVTIRNVPVQKSKFGDVLKVDMRKLERDVAKKILTHKVPIRGKEVKYLRKVNGLSMNRFGGMLGISGSAVLKWEKKQDQRLSPINEGIVRLIFAELLKVKSKISFFDLTPASSPEEIDYKIAV